MNTYFFKIIYIEFNIAYITNDLNYFANIEKSFFIKFDWREIKMKKIKIFGEKVRESNSPATRHLATLWV